MRSRRDQLQAYQFLRRRIVAALLSGEPDSPEAPMRRIVRTAFAGAMIAVLVAAGFAVFGVIRKGGATTWQKTDTIVIEKETGGIYVWTAPSPGAGRRLHPMVNHTSALLFLGSGTTKSLSRKSLAGIPRAPQRGIREAPGSVPEPRDLIRGPWAVCARTRSDTPEVSLLAGTPLPGVPLGPEAGLLVTGSGAPGERWFVVWKGQRFNVPDRRVLPALGFNDVTPHLVGAAWVSALPQGKDVTFPTIADHGQPTAEVDGLPTRVGQVFSVTGPGSVQYAVALGHGLAPSSGRGLASISEGVARLMLADPAGVSRTARELSPAAFAVADRVDPPPDFAGYPERALQPTEPGQGVLCTSVSGSAEAASPQAVYAVGQLPGDVQVVDLRGLDGAKRALADRAYLRAGSAALVRAHGLNKTRFLITDVGKKFPIGDDEALQALGLDKAQVAMVPAQFLDLLPDGPALSREAGAQTPV